MKRFAVSSLGLAAVMVATMGTAQALSLIHI